MSDIDIKYGLIAAAITITIFLLGHIIMADVVAKPAIIIYVILDAACLLGALFFHNKAKKY